MIEIYAITLSEYIDSSLFSKILSIIPPEKREQIKRFAKSEDAIRGALSEILIRYLVKKKLDQTNIVLEKNFFGKPFFKNEKNFHFNISHSGRWIICAIDNDPIGIDIEQISPIDLKIATKIFSNKECKEILSKSDMEGLLYFYKIWTLKESYAKAIGKGLLLPFDSFSITMCGNIIKFTTQNDLPKKYFKQYSVFSKYTMAVCAGKNLFPTHIKLLHVWELCEYLENKL